MRLIRRIEKLEEKIASTKERMKVITVPYQDEETQKRLVDEALRDDPNAFIVMVYDYDYYNKEV